jgi:hypothetical protein
MAYGYNPFDDQIRRKTMRRAKLHSLRMSYMSKAGHTTPLQAGSIPGCHVIN